MFAAGFCNNMRHLQTNAKGLWLLTLFGKRGAIDSGWLRNFVCGQYVVVLDKRYNLHRATALDEGRPGHPAFAAVRGVRLSNGNAGHLLRLWHLFQMKSPLLVRIPAILSNLVFSLIVSPF